MLEKHGRLTSRIIILSNIKIGNLYENKHPNTAKRSAGKGRDIFVEHCVVSIKFS